MNIKLLYKDCQDIMNNKIKNVKSVTKQMIQTLNKFGFKKDQILIINDAKLIEHTYYYQIVIQFLYKKTKTQKKYDSKIFKIIEFKSTGFKKFKITGEINLNELNKTTNSITFNTIQDEILSNLNFIPTENMIILVKNNKQIIFKSNTIVIGKIDETNIGNIRKCIFTLKPMNDNSNILPIEIYIDKNNFIYNLKV